MNTILATLLLGALTACAQETTNTVSERRNPDGTLRWRVETTSRGKTPVLRVRQSFKAGTTNTTRSYVVGGETVLMESDEDGDGFFETIFVYRPSTTDLEVFTRQRDGSVRPVSARSLAAYKKQQAAIADFWDKTFDKGADADKFSDQMRETQRKLREADKERKDGAK
jgi:hypothetical protein